MLHWSMGKVISIIKEGSVRGVDSSSDPLRLGQSFLRHAINLRFQSGRIHPRPAFNYTHTGLTGRFQGAAIFRPSRGISFKPFAAEKPWLATAVDGQVWINSAPASGVEGCAKMLKNPEQKTECGRFSPDCSKDIHIYQAENILIIQGFQRKTMWWSGEGDLKVSKGMVDDSEQGPEHSHDTFQDDKHRNFLANNAGLGIFWNGRVHQQGQYVIYVGDLIHKRGHLGTTDIVLMEEQSLCDPLSTNSKMGALLALEGAPRMGTANGEGNLVGYYENGIVEFNTFQKPRLQQRTGKGEPIGEVGWDLRQMVTHNTNIISATGRYAVGVLPRDHFFRSGFGIHVLSRVLGVEFINDEPVNVISDEVAEVLNNDDPELLHGAAAGNWLQGHRWFMTTGMRSDPKISSSPAGAGFVSFNRLWGRTQDNTPQPVWEGVWLTDSGQFGIHRFLTTGNRDDYGAFGFLSSDGEKNVWFVTITDDSWQDQREGKKISIPWAFETGRFNLNDTTRTKTVVDGRFEGLFKVKGGKVRVYIRTDRAPQWAKWKEFNTVEQTLVPGTTLRVSQPLGTPPESHEEATWFEFRVEGTEAAEITGFDVEFSEGSGKMDLQDLHIVKEVINTDPLSVSL